MADSIIYRLKIVLDEIDPPVYRVVDLWGWYDFQDLHMAIQTVMPWEDAHLFNFHVRRKVADKHGIIISPDPDEEMSELQIWDMNDLLLRDVLTTPWFLIKYWYDFGDDWKHSISVVSMGPPEAGVEYPRVVEGAGKCPGEDSGGVWGYYERLEARYDRSSAKNYDLREVVAEEERRRKPINLKKLDKDLKFIMSEREESKELRLTPEIDFGPEPKVKKRGPRKKKGKEKDEQGSEGGEE
jgi:hypothetical protein